MAKTEVKLTYNDGAYVPSVDAVHVVAGDAVSFSTNGGNTAYAFFSPDAASVLSPKPAIPLSIPSGHKSEFSFSSSKPGAYSAFFLSDPHGSPGTFSRQSSEFLRLEIVMPNDVPPFSGGDDSMTRGH